MSEEEYEQMIQKQTLHGFAIVLPIQSLRDAAQRDLWMRLIVVFFGGIAMLGFGLAWRNQMLSSELQMRLLRASELNTHLKEMNIAAAGLAHETRNPLNIIRGVAHMISHVQEAAPEIREKSRIITDEVDRVTAQLNEFINYSRPREVRRAPVALNSVVSDVVRALDCDLEEKTIRLTVLGEELTVEADEQLLRQVLFNLLINAVQAVDIGGHIQITSKKANSEAILEVSDNGPGVSNEVREEIFKPYFTTRKTGTGLGLAVVHQIVLAHGWTIECVNNSPHGAIFRVSGMKLSRSS
jgi:signal transduction histidine kinase